MEYTWQRVMFKFAIRWSTVSPLIKLIVILRRSRYQTLIHNLYLEEGGVGEREILLRKLTRTIKGSSKKSATRDDGRNSRKQQQQQYLAGFGRPVRSTDVHDVHRSWSGRPARSTEGLWLTNLNSRVVSVDRPGRPITRDWQEPTLGLDRSTGPVDRSLEIWEVGRPAGRPTVGSGRNLLFREVMYLSSNCNF